MELANQYGINLGNILTTANNIQTARLNKKLMGEKINTYEAGKKLKSDYLNVLNGGKSQYTPEQMNTLSQQAPDTAMAIQEKQQLAENQKAYTQYFINKGYSKAEAQMAANGHIDDMIKVNSAYAKADKEQRQRIKDNMAQTGQMVQTLMETAKKDPNQAEKMYQGWRNDQNEKIKELYKSGQNKIADKLQEGLDKAPPTLLNKDGSFNAEFPMMTLAKMSWAMQTADNYDAQQKAKTKNTLTTTQKLINERDAYPKGSSNWKEIDNIIKKKGTISKPTGSTTTLSKYYDMLKNTTDPEKRKEIKSVIYKMAQPKLNSLGITMNTIKDAQEKFAYKVGLKSPYELGTVDTSKWTPELRAHGNELAHFILKGTSTNISAVNKQIANYGAMSTQMSHAVKAYNKVSNFRLLDEATKKYLSNYTGLSKEELQSSDAAMAFQSMQNIFTKINSGTAVSSHEMVKNIAESATSSMDKRKIMLGIKNMAQRQIGGLNALKKSMGPIPFNLMYGTMLKNYMDIKKAAHDQAYARTKSKQTPTVKQLRTSTQKNTIREGQTATNPSTGEKIIFRNGNWEKL